MTALSADVARIQEGVNLRKIGVDASKTIYRGGMVVYNTTQYIQAAADTALFRFAGVAAESQEGSSVSGDKKVLVARRGIFKFATGSTLAAKHIGIPMCITDDNTVALPWETTNRIYCGKLVDFVSGFAYIEIDDAVAGRISDLVKTGTANKTIVGDQAGVVYKVPKGRKARICNLKTFLETIPAYATSCLLVVSNRDASAGADDNMLSTANVDLEDDTAKEVTVLTLTGTAADLELDEDDVLFFVATGAGTETTAGEGFALTAEIVEW